MLRSEALLETIPRPGADPDLPAPAAATRHDDDPAPGHPSRRQTAGAQAGLTPDGEGPGAPGKVAR